ncbi:hypothetical protein RvY_15468 [Ramazzottius varieornatus]|uniref:Uncharacterized protein n=1 Tax=Ramazzottius varieornatus TaxID=947166 RepID=A0A1D1VV09_RAMVA|nr:hypothetical protein RvY_15468 [Ramazzottius varieornatus]
MEQIRAMGRWNSDVFNRHVRPDMVSSTQTMQRISGKTERTSRSKHGAVKFSFFGVYIVVIRFLFVHLCYAKVSSPAVTK